MGKFEGESKDGRMGKTNEVSGEGTEILHVRRRICARGWAPWREVGARVARRRWKLKNRLTEHCRYG